MRTIRDIFGRPSHQPFAFYDPGSSSVRTSQATLLSDSTPSSPTLPRWGSMCGGALYELPTPEPLTNAHGSSGLLGTPSAADAMGGHLSRGGARSHELLLKGQVKALLPTTTAQDAGGSRGHRRDGTPYSSSSGVTLTDAVETLLPTPAAGEPGGTAERFLERKNRDGGQRTQPTHLTHVVQLLPTPAVNDMGAGKTPDQWDSWTDSMREKHGNGNGHGRSLSIEAQRLLPTPSGSDSTGGEGPTREARQQDGTTGGPMLRDIGHLLPTPNVSHGEPTSPRSDGGSKSTGQHPDQLTIEAA